MRPALALLVVALLAAGCVAPAAEEAAEPAAWEADAAEVPAGSDGGGGDASGAAPQGADASGGSNGTGAASGSISAPPSLPPLRVSGTLPLEGACAPACPALAFEVILDGPAPPGRLALDVVVRWDGAASPGLALDLRAPPGAEVVRQRGFDAARVLVMDPPAGAYEVALDGAGPVVGRARLVEVGATPKEGDLLPNLVTLVPADVGLAPCDPWEAAEQGATRCLRLSNAIGNVGHGPLEVALALEDGATTPLGQGRFAQRIHQASGAPREAPVGGADFHPTHAHFHYEGLARFSLHPVDPLTGLRGEAVSAHHKAGFCLLDIGEMEEPDVAPEQDGARRAEQACLVPEGPSGWSMGVSRGHYDEYGSGLTDQYVEVGGVPDGVYELVSACNWNGSLAETDPADNAASVLLRLSGDRVEVLEERGFYRIPDRA